MPIYEYVCKNCGEKIEVLHRNEMQMAPQKCGFRCVLPPHDPREFRGFGDLARCYSNFSSQAGSSLQDNPSLNDIKKAGFSMYSNEGNGIVKKIFGKGPKKIDTKEQS